MRIRRVCSLMRRRDAIAGGMALSDALLRVILLSSSFLGATLGFAPSSSLRSQHSTTTTSHRVMPYYYTLVGTSSSIVPRSLTTPVSYRTTGGSGRRERYLTLRQFSVNSFLPDGVGGNHAIVLARDVLQSLFQYHGPIPFVQALGVNVVLFAALRSKLLTALTPTGFAHSLALGTMLWTTLGWRGWSYCVMYLVMGQLVTKVKFQDKQQRGLAEKRGGRRGPENVWGSALTSLLCAACSVQGETFLGISASLWLLGFVAALATKLADTFASEIGKAYGKTTFLITNLKRVEPGTEGAVSAEGTAAAVVGGLLLSLYGVALGLIEGWPMVAISTMAAFLATNAESLIGATLQDRKGFGFMTNEVVNFINTLIGGALAILAGKYFL